MVEIISNDFLWTLMERLTNKVKPEITYKYQRCANPGCRLQNLKSDVFNGGIPREIIGISCCQYFLIMIMIMIYCKRKIGRELVEKGLSFTIHLRYIYIYI